MLGGMRSAELARDDAPAAADASIARLLAEDPVDEVALAAAVDAVVPALSAPQAEQMLATLCSHVRWDDGAQPPHPSLSIVLAELALISGQLRTATTCCHRARDAADRIGDDPTSLRSRAFLAVLHALNGEYATSRELLVQSNVVVERLGGRDRLGRREEYPLLCAASLIAAADFDAQACRDLEQRFQAHGEDLLWQASGELAGAMADFLSRDLARAKARLMRALGRADRQGILDLVEGLSLGLLADVHLASASPQKALGVLAGRPDSLGDHVLCFSMQRASALLQLHQDLDVIAVTNDCVHMGPRHCMRTYAPLLLRRSLAFTRLGRLAEADQELAEAIEVVSASGSMTPYMGVPHDELAAAVAGLRERTGAVSESLDILIVSLQAIPHEAARIKAPLTRTELQIAQAIATGARVEDIAQSMFVSVNTVKFHLRSIYTKLGVHDRHAASALLSSLGLLSADAASEEPA